jgi:hypothetical protein
VVNLSEIRKHITKKWEISIIELKNNGKKYKVTRRLPELAVAETKIFDSKENALKLFHEWLD